MPTTPLRRLAAGVLLGLTLCVVLGGAPARAQLTAEPQSLSLDVEQHATVTRTVTLTNAGDTPLTFCVSFERPLQRVAGGTRLADGAAGGGEACGEYGEVLYYLGEDDVEESGWSPYGLTMTPYGRLFSASSSVLHRTFELTPDLQLVGWFEHPHVAELTTFAATLGVTFDVESGTLWWLNVERTGGSDAQTRRILLLEGDLDGEETGRRIEVVPPDEPLEEFYAGGPSYDPAMDRFYFLGISDYRQKSDTWRIWAVDRQGTVPEGYPVRPEPYPDGIFNVPDAHGGAAGGPEGIRIEYGAYPPFGPGNDRIVVVDRWGNSQGEALETPVPDMLFEAGGAGIRGNPLRSRIDPNGVMYMTFTNFDDEGIVGVRPHPLPPSWLVVDSDAGAEAAWDGTLAPGGSREVVLTFRAGARAVGDYTSSLQAFDAATGEAVVVPLSLTVTQGTGTEDEPAASEAASLTVYPNPSASDATVALALVEAADVRVVVYDVLGREVAVLHAGRLGAGAHELSLDGTKLPAGVYVVRAEVGGVLLSQRVTVVR